jgi:hypothetical protein
VIFCSLNPAPINASANAFTKAADHTHHQASLLRGRHPADPDGKISIDSE